VSAVLQGRFDVRLDSLRTGRAHRTQRDLMKMILNGQRVDATTGQRFPVHNPSTGEVIDCVPRADSKDVARAIEVAPRGKSIIPALPARQRSEILGKTADGIGRRHEELSQLLDRENGKTIRQCRFEMTATQRLFVDFAEEAKRIRGSYLPMDAVPGLEHMVAYTIRQPIGIVVGIIPFNYPAELFAHKIRGAIAASNWSSSSCRNSVLSPSWKSAASCSKRGYASVFSENIHNALTVAHKLEVGGVVINGAGAFRPGSVPVGGFKQSGIGREGITDTILGMTEGKAIVISHALS
jgi:acyl-CoA reductase-like NAD-dependent aldehyde dehydrogenase